MTNQDQLNINNFSNPSSVTFGNPDSDDSRIVTSVAALGRVYAEHYVGRAVWADHGEGFDVYAYNDRGTPVRMNTTADNEHDAWVQLGARALADPLVFVKPEAIFVWPQGPPMTQEKYDMQYERERRAYSQQMDIAAGYGD